MLKRASDLPQIVIYRGLIASIFISLTVGFSNCSNPMREAVVECESVLNADSVYAGRTKVDCQDSTLRSTLDNCTWPFGGNAGAPYSSVTWHPSGQFIAFNHTPLERIEFPNGENCPGREFYNRNASGYWLSDIDGSSMRRVRASYFGSPAWSPGGEWLAFDNGAQIWKIRFTGKCFDESTLTQLTTVGRNFLPDWSPDGQWIAYDRSLADESGPAGIWIMRADGSEKQHIAGGRHPDWHPEGNSLIYYGLYSEIYRVNLDNPSQVVKLTSLNENDIYATTNRHPKYSPDGTRIAFTSQPLNGIINIWIMNADGSDLRQLTTDGATEWFDWSPDGRKIIYTKYQSTSWTYCNGTLWTVDVFTGEKQQITYNYLPSE
jgi:Tol biopolymer transport system component